MKFDVSDITNNIAKDIEITEDMLTDYVGKIALEVHADCVLATPVDTGQARQGWEVTTPTTAYEDGIVENNVSYIGHLNDGHSNQAPAGFVDTIVQKHSQ